MSEELNMDAYIRYRIEKGNESYLNACLLADNNAWNAAITRLISIDLFRLYSDLMDWRQKGDYGDLFDFDEETVQALLIPTKQFLNEVTVLIKFSDQ